MRSVAFFVFDVDVVRQRFSGRGRQPQARHLTKRRYTWVRLAFRMD